MAPPNQAAATPFHSYRKPKPDTKTIIAIFTHSRAGPQLPKPGGEGTDRQPGETIQTSTHAVSINPNISYDDMMKQCISKVEQEWQIQMQPPRWSKRIYVTLSKEGKEAPLTVSDEMSWGHARSALCTPDSQAGMEFKYFEMPEGEWVESEMGSRKWKWKEGCGCCVLQ